MPLLNNDEMVSTSIGGSNYNFSGARIDSLGATEYTLVTLVCDVSGSVSGYRDDLEKTLGVVVEACRKSPRADNLLLRVVLFNTSVHELHGFKPLQTCNMQDYTGQVQPSGCTSLRDATYNSVEASNIYAKSLVMQDFDVNGLVVVLTDGQDNTSTFNTSKCREALDNCTQQEYMESMVSILVGVGAGSKGNALDTYLTSFKDEVGFTQYVSLEDADSKTMARLANFISKSISSQSQALGTGGPSQSLSF